MIGRSIISIVIIIQWLHKNRQGACAYLGMHDQYHAETQKPKIIIHVISSLKLICE